MVFLKQKRNLIFLSLSLVTLCFFFFRFYNLINRINFDWDQANLSFFVSKILKQHDLALIGHQATDVMGFYFAPYFEYLFVPFYFFTSMDPIAQLPFIVLINLMLLPLMFHAIKKLFGTPLALGFTFLWAVNPILIVYDITVWTPILIPPGIFLTFLFLFRLYRSPSRLNFLFLGLILGFFSHSHSLFFFIDFFVFFFFVFYLLEKRMKLWDFSKKLVILSLGFIVFLVPLVIFDLRHNFLNSRLFVNYFVGRTSGTTDIGQTIQVFSNFFHPLFFAESPIAGIFFFIAILIILFWLSRNSASFHRLFYLSVFSLWILAAFIFLRYRQRPSEYYFFSLYPFVAVALLDFLKRGNKYAIALYCAVFLFFNWSWSLSLLQSRELGMVGKKEVIAELKKRVDGERFQLIYEMPLGLDTGYDYLLEYYGIKPYSGTKDPVVRLRIPAKKNDIAVNGVGIVLPKDLK